MPRVEVSLVVPVYNEQHSLPHFWTDAKRVLETLDCTWEVVFVNDGSVDASPEILRRIVAETPEVRVINLSRNFGHEAAMLAGIDYSRGSAVICLDADLQHPPSLIPEMLARHRDGYAIVHMVREQSLGLCWSNRLKSWLFYKLLNLISPTGFTVNASDFFLLDHKVCNLLRKEFRERSRFLRGLIQVVGFSRATLPFIAPARVAGETKYSLLQLFNVSLTALATFSRLPLRMGLLFGVICGMFSAIVGGYSIVMKIMGNVVTGYTTIVVLIAFLFAVQLIIIGIIGEYIGYIFEEVKRRPIYVLDSLIEGEGDHIA